MRGKSLHIGKIRGIGFEIHYTWFPIFLLLMVVLGFAYADIHPNWPYFACWLCALLSALLLFASVLAHESAHSLVALRYDIPVRSITLFFFGGVARIIREASSPKAEFRMAIAGPLCSLGLGAIFGTVWFLSEVEFIEGLASYLALVNLVLAGFNFLPGFPLDGGRVLRSLIWNRTGDDEQATRIALLGGKIVSYLLIAGGLGGTSILFLSYGEPWLGGVWLALIGLFLQTAVGASTRQARMKKTLGELLAREAMIPRYLPDKIEVVDPSDNGLSVLERMDRMGLEELAVMERGEIIGIIRRNDLLWLAEERSKNRGERI